MDDLPDTAPGFAEPLGMLRACHERIRSHCATLRRLVEHVRERGPDAEARAAAAGVIRYFDDAARRHHDDEEHDLLPRMVSAATLGRGSSLTRLVADVANEHRALDRAWIELRAALQAVAAGEPIGLNPLAVDSFVKLYHSHLVMEESNVLPLAEMLLSKEDLAAIGAAMAARRGVRLP